LSAVFGRDSGGRVKTQVRILFSIRKLFTKRLPGWAKLSCEFLRGKKCAACGRKTNLIAHHIVPVHIDPSRELDVTNLMPLCEGKTFNCHLMIGHLGHFKSYNPTAVDDAARVYERLKTRPIVAMNREWKWE
jgi:hypothetical protein